MTKPKPPEFTTYDEAKTWVSAGRGSKTTRATSDAWNTTLMDDGKTMRLIVNKHDLVHFSDDTTGMVIVAPNKRDFTERERINRYVLHPRKMDLDRKWHVWQTVQVLNGNAAVPYKVDAGVFGDELVVSNFGITTPLSGGKPLVMTNAKLKALSVKWLKNVMLPALAAHALPLPTTCSGCRPTAGNRLSAEAAHDPEHVYAHIVGGEVAPPLLLRAMQHYHGTSAAGHALNQVGTSIGPASPPLEATSIVLKNYINRILLK